MVVYAHQISASHAPPTEIKTTCVPVLKVIMTSLTIPHASPARSSVPLVWAKPINVCVALAIELLLIAYVQMAHMKTGPANYALLAIPSV